MEFTLSTQRDLSHYHHSLEVVEQYLLSKLDRINERETSDPKLGQEIYLLKHQRELSRLVEEEDSTKITQGYRLHFGEGLGERNFKS